MNTLSMSSYSVREHLGPIHFNYVDADGNDQSFGFDYPKLLELHEFPARARSAFGVTDIETVQFQFAQGLDDPELDLFAQALTDSGVRLLNVAVDVGDLLEEDPSADVSLLKRWILRFAEMGSAFVRVNSGSPFSPRHGEQPPESLVNSLKDLGAFATDNSTRLLVENHGGPSSDPVWMSRLLDAVGRDHLGLLLDLGNFDALLQWTMVELVTGAKPEGQPDLTTLYEGVDALADYAELVHVKAHQVDDDGTVGFVDLPRALGILASHGYDGPLTVEYEGNGGDPWQKSARVLELTRITNA